MLDTAKLTFKTKNIPETETISAETGLYYLYLQLTKIPYCDKIIYSPKRNCITLRLSYPRVFDRTNAYLIKTSEECQEVHHKLINDILTFDDSFSFEEADILREWFIKYVAISITRVEIPFTYYIPFTETFNSYSNVYNLMVEVFEAKNKVKVKDIGVTINGERETYTFPDKTNVRDCYKKITIYNQAKKFQDLYSNKPKVYNVIINKYPYLKYRMRIEVSRKVGLDGKSLEEFSEFKIYEEYVTEFANYALENLFDESILSDVCDNKSEELAELLEKSREMKNLNYRGFIYSNKDKIYDYTILRNAIFRTTKNSNTKYSASHDAREILKELERETGIIYINTKARMRKIADFFRGIIRGEEFGK